ncbi:scarecrow-like protein 1 [Phragmites australis]|uniref:scarecrow-like protein 1 n=1 Tax=Phragmites australis TaxID=29695 RepID=UPI002D77EE97|nr:scarecrow-like protein 1 [Phragmites australis]
MSFVAQADPSTSCAESPYIHKFGPQGSGFSAQRFASGTELPRHGPQPYNAEGYRQSSFNGAPPPVFQNSFYNEQVAPTPYCVTANGQTLATTLDSHFESHFNAATCSPAISNISQQNSQSLSENQSSDLEVEFDEDEIRLKLQELEHALLDDDDEVFSDLSGSINDEWNDSKNNNEWSNTMKNIMHLDSPKESSPESSLSCPDSNNGEARDRKQLLFDCAEAISEYSIDEAQSIIRELRQKVAIQGDPSQRIAAYLVESLAATIQSSGKGIYRALRCKEAPTLYQLSAMQILFEICPCFRLGFMAANYAILEACKEDEIVHIIDFDINQGSQYITLIQLLQNNSNKPLHLRITGVDDPESVHRTVGGLKVVGQRLEKLAEDCEVSFEFRAVAADIGDVTPGMLNCRPGEALIVNFAFLLHHLPDESVSIVNERDQLLRLVKGLQPKLVMLVEQDANTNTTPFLTRFREVYDYYSALFDSLDSTLPRESPDRMNVERQCLAREIVNILACEGPDRVERYEVAGKWRARMAMAGFVPSPFNSNVIDGIRSLLKSYCDKYRFEKIHDGLHFGWGDKTLVVSSAWQ